MVDNGTIQLGATTAVDADYDERQNDRANNQDAPHA